MWGFMYNEIRVKYFFDCTSQNSLALVAGTRDLLELWVLITVTSVERCIYLSIKVELTF